MSLRQRLQRLERAQQPVITLHVFEADGQITKIVWCGTLEQLVRASMVKHQGEGT